MPIDPDGEGSSSGTQNEGIVTVTHENPMYRAYEHMSPEEQAVSFTITISIILVRIVNRFTIMYFNVLNK